MAESKTCSRCSVEKDLAEFNKQDSGRFGFRADCKTCQKAYNDAYREANRNALREYNRLYRHAHPEQRAERERRWRRDNPQEHIDRVKASRLRHAEKHAARRTLMHAIEDGLVVKPSCCDDCGTEDRRIDGHHTDYSRPLVVDWLCTRCHGQRHRHGSGLLVPVVGGDALSPP